MLTATTAFVPDANDGATLGSTTREFADLFLADGGQILFGNDQDVTLTHVADTGILLNSTMAIQFNDASQFINAPSATVLDINATDEIELNATLVDVNANLDVSGTVTAGAITSSAGATITTADNTAQLTLKSTDADANVGPLLVMMRDSSSPADNDILSRIDFKGDNDAGQETFFGSINAVATDVSDGAEDGQIKHRVMVNGTVTSMLDLDASGATFGGNIVIPDAGTIGSASDADALTIASDGKITASQTAAIVGHASVGVDAINSARALTVAGATDGSSSSILVLYNSSLSSKLSVRDDGFVDIAGNMQITTAGNDVQLILKSTDADANNGPILDMIRDSGSPADNDEVGIIRFKFDDDAGEVNTAVQFQAKIEDASNGAEDGSLEITTLIGGSSRSRIELLSTETVFNEDSLDVDFRVESDSQMASFFVEGSTSNIGIGHNTPTADAALAGVSVPSGSKYVHVHDGDGAVLKLSDPADGSNRGGQVALFNTTMVVNNCESGDMIFGTSNAERMKILSGGNVDISAGHLLLDSGYGIDFSATGDGAGTDSSELFDDYEEGTFTPTFGQGVDSPSYTTQNGRYTKIGRHVYYEIDLNLASGTGNSSGLEIHGLPYASSSSAPYGGGYLLYQQNFETDIDMVFFNTAGTTEVAFYTYITGATYTGNMANGITALIRIAGHYTT